jgi:hypothetical protein
MLQKEFCSDVELCDTCYGPGMPGPKQSIGLNAYFDERRVSLANHRILCMII